MEYIILTIIIITAIIIGIILIFLDRKYDKFIDEHSDAMVQLRLINREFYFKEIKNIVYNHAYDNENFYEIISTKDYLTYQLQFTQKEVEEEITKVLENQNLYDFYLADIKEKIKFGYFNEKVPFKNIERLLKKEKEKVELMMKKPALNLQLTVILSLTNIDGELKRYKRKTFSISEVNEIIFNLNDKYKGRYNKQEIWDALSRVERGKVSNKMRFAIYQRDGYRCRKCNRNTDDLEIDHIIPISKGGKTTFDNLQTLCHRCNANKADTIESNNVPNYYSGYKKCPECGGLLKLKSGKYGIFYGCMNYPNCRYTKKYD